MKRKSKPKAEPALEKRNIDDLRPHESQAAYFEDLSDPELERLADSIQRNGLETPIQITPDDRIIKGHQRLRACKLLGWTEVDVWVRYDLQDDEKQIEYELISDNLDRRQLGPIEIARCYRRLKKLERRKSGGRRKHAGEGDLRDLLAKRFEMSGRNLDMLEEALDTPEVVQWAVAKKYLPVTLARRIARLPADEQKALAGDIAEWKESEGIDDMRLRHAIKRLARQYLSTAAEESPAPRSKPGMATIADAMVKTLPRVESLLTRKPERRSLYDLAKFKQAHETLGRVIEKLESPEEG